MNGFDPIRQDEHGQEQNYGSDRTKDCITLRQPEIFEGHIFHL